MLKFTTFRSELTMFSGTPLIADLSLACLHATLIKAQSDFYIHSHDNIPRLDGGLRRLDVAERNRQLSLPVAYIGQHTR